MIRKIEIEFAIPVELEDEEMRELDALVQRVAKRHEPEGHVHWCSGQGQKPLLSKADARFLKKEPRPDAPETGEPEWDPDILYIETSCRPQYHYHCRDCNVDFWETDQPGHWSHDYRTIGSYNANQSV